MVRRSLPPQVRARGVTAVLGPTNTGKTHLAIERMLGHDSGMIGLPLRLLAREVYQRVVEKAGHHNVALITGEEKIKPDKPRYWISTVEAMPRDIDASFVAIDEIQLAADLDRGHVFTDRLLNQRGRQETLLIGSMTMRPLIEALIPGVHVVTRPRLSKLTFSGEKKVSRLPRRSAIVAFSAEEVYGIAELIRRQSGGAAVVLGALSPRTRNAQVELYQNGDVDYLIATDAIGMGLNLDVDHVAFASDKKFDGFRFRKLYNPELAQIAGRAGRYMRDGTFGSTGRCPPFDAETVEALENHTFDPVRILQWRNPDLDFSSIGRLRDSLGAQPREHGLVRAPMGEDLASLEILAREDDIQAFARTKYAVERLWQICQVPDYRKVSPQTHADLVGQLYRFLMKDGAVPADWFARHLSASDRTDGDIDTLSNRIAQVRTWSFVANRPDWLKDPEHWQGVARQVEDKLSDALHERLAQRFIDRRTSVLMRRLRENTMLEAEITTTGDVTVEGQHIGHLHGFHFVPDPQADTTEAKTLRNAASKALAGEIETRADRFAETPDTTLVLSNDGTIRWQGDPVAKLEPGDKLFEPRVRILSDEHLTGPARDKVENRLRAWLKAYVVRLLGPAMDLETNAELAGLARGIAFQIGEAIGVLERAKVLNEVRSLDQDARAALRKAGVRFGAYHLYLPALLKPAPRVLATQLWALQNGGLDQKGIDEIAHLAQSGRTSIPVDAEIAAGLYRAAGFRVCGGRAVRVDILERLADLIRPAISYRPGITPGEPPAGAADGEGFVPTVAMTSLVGCAGEDFATILKSLGYVMERRPGPAITVPLVQAASTEPAAVPPAEAPADAPAEGQTLAEETGAVAVEAPDASVSAETVVESASEAVASPEGQALAPTEGAAEAAPEAPSEPEMVEIWRQHRRHHEGGHARQGREARGGRHERGERSERGDRPERGDRRPRHGEGQGERPRREAQGEGGRPQNRPPRGPRPDDRRGPRPDKRADNRREGGHERREKQPDPNSPFAKLMALKAQLEDGKK
ncbi:helicase-related protein [Microvirga guangxiensis]|uniref:ATP-dependent RNA helicase SUPV3L1/SUV3 n=1 Tax=Microvirga guangxiensis TaxID=549386 RepID=A0A1G5EBG2_9HYPH|nr:helicase-related protein [Microvirga guangxiensis]SCY24277.1 ATP-dependent RNA helicase SUPV3L1/SUV3 [Microvirga guangxiensis]